MIGAYYFLFCLYMCVCMFVVIVNLRYNYWTVRGRDFINDTQMPLMMHFNWTHAKVNDLVTLTFNLKDFMEFIAGGGIVFHIYLFL